MTLGVEISRNDLGASKGRMKVGRVIPNKGPDRRDP